LLVGVQRDAVMVWQCGEFVADANQTRRVGLRIAIEFELEVTGARIFVAIGDAACTLDFIVEADGMPDRDALQPPSRREKLRDVAGPQIGRQARIDACDIPGHAVENIYAERAQQCIQDRLVDFGRPECGGKRWDVFLGTGLDLRRNHAGMEGKRGLESRMRQIKIACDGERTPQFVDGLPRRQLRALVEPFRRHQFGAGAHRSGFAFDLDLGTHEYLRRGIDDHGAEAKRFCERNRPFKK
jgi:hypothetical protein